MVTCIPVRPSSRFGRSAVGSLPLWTLCRLHAPEHVSRIVGHKKRSVTKHGQPARAAVVLVRIDGDEESCQEVFPGRPTAGERNERDVVAEQFGTVPRAVLTDERTAAEAL